MLAEQSVNKRTTGQLSSAGRSDIFTHVFTRVITAAATSLPWTTVFLNRSETTSGPLSNGRALKMYS